MKKSKLLNYEMAVGLIGFIIFLIQTASFMEGIMKHVGVPIILVNFILMGVSVWGAILASRDENFEEVPELMVVSFVVNIAIMIYFLVVHKIDIAIAVVFSMFYGGIRTLLSAYDTRKGCIDTNKLSDSSMVVISTCLWLYVCRLHYGVLFTVGFLLLRAVYLYLVRVLLFGDE